MTGYGRAKKTLSNRDITVEVRSVNNRYLDCTVKLPRAYIFAEDAIKGRVQKAISRGKVDVFVTIDSTGADEEVVVVNEGLARSYLEALRKLYEIDGGNYLQKKSYAADLARIPDVLTVTKAEEDLESLGADICEVLDEALAAYNEMRATEGRKLAEDIGGRRLPSTPTRSPWTRKRCACAPMCRSCAACCSPMSPWAARWTSSFRRSTARAIPSARSATM